MVTDGTNGSLKSALKPDRIWKVVIAILAFLVALQLFYNRRMYDVTIFTYRVMQSYYKDGRNSSSSLHGLNSNTAMKFNSEEKLNEEKIDGVFDAIGISSPSTTDFPFPTTKKTGVLNSSFSPSGDSAGHETTDPSSTKETCIPKLGTKFIFDGDDRSDFNASPGGEWTPSDCQPVSHVALIIPFRNRHSHLLQFSPYMHAFLQKQLLHYRIFAIDQNDSEVFNRAKLMNVGYAEASKLGNFTCYVFHDVDLLPIDERIGYNCSDKGPIHLASAMDKFGFKMPYDGYFGGACSFTPQQLVKMNGFSNKYFGWGGEDDDIAARVSLSGQTAQRFPIQISRYHMIKHGADKGNDANPQRWNLLDKTKATWRWDGLNSLTYKVLEVEENTLYTRIAVDISV